MDIIQKLNYAANNSVEICHSILQIIKNNLKIITEKKLAYKIANITGDCTDEMTLFKYAIRSGCSELVTLLLELIKEENEEKWKELDQQRTSLYEKALKTLINNIIGNNEAKCSQDFVEHFLKFEKNKTTPDKLLIELANYPISITTNFLENVIIKQCWDVLVWFLERIKPENVHINRKYLLDVFAMFGNEQPDLTPNNYFIFDYILDNLYNFKDSYLKYYLYEKILINVHAAEIFEYLLSKDKNISLNDPSVLEMVSKIIKNTKLKMGSKDIKNIKLETVKKLVQLGAKLPKDLTKIKDNLSYCHYNNEIKKYFEKELGVGNIINKYYLNLSYQNPIVSMENLS